MSDSLPDPPPGGSGVSAPPDLLSRRLTLKETILWGSLAILFMALVIGRLAWNDREMSAPASPLRIPSAPSAMSYSVITAHDYGLNGEDVRVEGEIVGADFPFRDMPKIWVAGSQFGLNPTSGLPHAIPLRFPDDAQVTADGRRVSIEAYIGEVNLAHNAPRTVRIQATVRVVGGSAFVSSCVLESEPASDP